MPPRTRRRGWDVGSRLPLWLAEQTAPVPNISASCAICKVHMMSAYTQKITFKQKNTQATCRSVFYFKWLKWFLMKIWISSRSSKNKAKAEWMLLQIKSPSFITELNMSYLGTVCEAPEMSPKFILKLQIFSLKTTMIKHGIYRCLLFSKAAIWEKSKP